jgi:hypothetical protein
MDGLIDDLRHQFVDRAMIAVHGTPAASAIFYREVAGHGPSSDVVLVSFTVREDAETSLKTPEFLAALQASQRRLEGLTGVVGTYSVADDLMLTRRVVHKGDPGAYVLPHKQVEVVQLLLLYQMSGHAAEFGERIADGGEVTVMRVALTAMDDETRAEVVARIAQTLAIGFPEGVEARLCAP